MTGIGGTDEEAAVKAATDISAHLAQNLSPFVLD